MRKILINKHIVLILFFGIIFNGLAQEQLRPLSGNINLQTKQTNNTLASKSTTLVALDTLPFFDDFSYSTKSPYPTTKHWIDSNVYINNGFPIAPISIGVATFDGLNKKGYPYYMAAPVGSSARADTLTSRKINLEKKGALVYSPADSVYLSFYYQAEGRGDAPEPADELALEFYNPTTTIWSRIWYKPGYNPSATDTTFKRVMIPITNVQYFDSLFQFRFINKATLSGSLDHWHIDYVYLNKNRSKSDTIIEDVTFGYQSTPFLKNYSTMPYRQFVVGEMATNIHTYIRNNSLVAKTKSYKFDIYPKTGGPSLFNYSGGTNPITPFQPNGWHNNPSDFNPTFSYVFPTLIDSTFFKIVHTAIATPDYVRANDTLVQIQKLTNYYAYDDGTAEQGYYVNTYGAKTAVRFTLNANDTIKGLKIYFDPIVNGPAIIGSAFRIIIWADGGSGPSSSTLIYKDSLTYPQYLQGNYNLIPFYKLTSCLPLNAGTYYFGIQQQTSTALNIGFDRNTNHMDALYYDIGSGWTQSTIPGSLMINPVLGCYEPPIVIGLQEQNKNTDLVLYPNPAQNNLTIKTNSTKLENASVEIMNMMGQSVLKTNFNTNEAIDISTLPNGIYFVLLAGSGQTVSPKKLIISR
jgi:hypothetical protein